MKLHFIVNKSTRISLIGFSLICAWTGVLFIQNNSAHIAWSNFHNQVLILIALCGLVWLAGMFLAIVPMWINARWSIPRALCVYTIGIFIIFSHEAIRYWLKEIYHYNNNSSEVIYLLIVTGSLVLTWLISSFEPSRVAISITSAFLILFSLVSIGKISGDHVIHLFQKTRDITTKENMVEHTFSNENVYYIILDAHGGANALKKYLNHDITPFIEKMKGIGYTHINLARANYTVTHVSLAATLNARYILNESSRRYLDRGDFYPAIFNKKEMPSTVKIFQSHNYNFIHIGNSWAPCQLSGGVSCITGINESSLLESVITAYFNPTRIISLIEHILPRNSIIEYDALTPFSRTIREIKSLKKSSFVLIHHLIPHEPLNEDCSRYSGEMSEIKYKNSVTCVDNSVLQVAQQIEKIDPYAIVVIQADHGSDFHVDWKSPLAKWDSSAIDERTSILNLIHVPKPCQKWVVSNLSPINTMRLVYGCLERRKPDYLIERTYLTAYETSPDFGFVREVAVQSN